MLYYYEGNIFDVIEYDIHASNNVISTFKRIRGSILGGVVNFHFENFQSRS